MSESAVRFGFPLFWVGVGVVQWFWPAAIFPACSNEDVTPGARGFAVAWLCVGATLGLLFLPALDAFGGLFVPGFVLLVVGTLQWAHPAWSSPLPDVLTDRVFGGLLAAAGLLVLAADLL